MPHQHGVNSLMLLLCSHSAGKQCALLQGVKCHIPATGSIQLWQQFVQQCDCFEVLSAADCDAEGDEANLTVYSNVLIRPQAGGSLTNRRMT